MLNNYQFSCSHILSTIQVIVNTTTTMRLDLYDGAFIRSIHQSMSVQVIFVEPCRPWPLTRAIYSKCPIVQGLLYRITGVTCWVLQGWCCDQLHNFTTFLRTSLVLSCLFYNHFDFTLPAMTGFVQFCNLKYH